MIRRLSAFLRAHPGLVVRGSLALTGLAVARSGLPAALRACGAAAAALFGFLGARRAEEDLRHTEGRLRARRPGPPR